MQTQVLGSIRIGCEQVCEKFAADRWTIAQVIFLMKSLSSKTKYHWDDCIYHIFLSKIKGESVSGVFRGALRRAKRTISKNKIVESYLWLQLLEKCFLARRRRKNFGVFFGPPQAKKFSGFFFRVQIKSGYKLNEWRVDFSGRLCLQNEFICTSTLT